NWTLMADELLLSIEKLVYGGDGLAHAEGNTVFVPYVLPGEHVRAAVRTKKRKLVHAKLLEVTKAAPARIAPECPHFGVCGGCHYQHIAFAEQGRLKAEILRETLARLGGVPWTGEIHAHTAEPYGYRKRAHYSNRPVSGALSRPGENIRAIAGTGPGQFPAPRNPGD